MKLTFDALWQEKNFGMWNLSDWENLEKTHEYSVAVSLNGFQFSDQWAMQPGLEPPVFKNPSVFLSAQLYRVCVFLSLDPLPYIV